MQKTKVTRSSMIAIAHQANQSKKTALRKLMLHRERELGLLIAKMDELKKIDLQIDDLCEQTSLNRELGSTWQYAKQACENLSVNHAAHIDFHLPIDSAERDLWLVAIGAASRKVVLQRLGGMATVSVETATPTHQNHFRYVGVFRLHAAPHQATHSPEARQALRVVDAPAQWDVLVGLSGMIGQEIARNGCFKSPQDVNEFVASALVKYQVSETISDMIGMEWTTEDAWQTHELLVEAWRDVLFIAQELVENVADCQQEQFRKARRSDSTTGHEMREAIESLLAKQGTEAMSAA